jgi:hypothetical protein
MTLVSIPYKPMKSKFGMIIIVKSWFLKFVMWHNGTSNGARDEVVSVVLGDTWH